MSKQFLVFLALVVGIPLLELVGAIVPTLSTVSPLFILFKALSDNGMYTTAQVISIVGYPALFQNVPFIILGILLTRMEFRSGSMVTRIAQINVAFHTLAILNRVAYFLALTQDEVYVFYLNPIWMGMFALQVYLLVITSSLTSETAQGLKLVTYIKFIFDIFTLGILNFIFMLPYSIDPTAVLAGIYLVISVLVVTYFNALWGYSLREENSVADVSPVSPTAV